MSMSIIYLMLLFNCIPLLVFFILGNVLEHLFRNESRIVKNIYRIVMILLLIFPPIYFRMEFALHEYRGYKSAYEMFLQLTAYSLFGWMFGVVWQNLCHYLRTRSSRDSNNKEMVRINKTSSLLIRSRAFVVRLFNISRKYCLAIRNSRFLKVCKERFLFVSGKLLRMISENDYWKQFRSKTQYAKTFSLTRNKRRENEIIQRSSSSQEQEKTVEDL